MTRYGWSLWWLSCTVWAVLALGWAPMPAAAAAQPDPKTPKGKATEATQTLNLVVEAQRSLAINLSQLRDQLTELQRSLSEAREEIRQHHEALQGQLDQIKGMREEVRGLYVESSGLKGDIAQVGKQVEDLDDSLGNFRLSSGIVVAVVIVLQVVLMGLMFRGHG